MKAYLITDPYYYGTDVARFKKRLSRALQHHRVTHACFRDKTTPDIEALATAFVATCKRHRIAHIYINSHIELAHRLGATGVHLTSSQLPLIADAKALDLHVIASTHNSKEIALAQQLGADCITYSPVFTTPGKGNPKGLEDLKDKVDKIRVNIIALGGIVTAEHVKSIAKTGAYGFASIRYFIDTS